MKSLLTLLLLSFITFSYGQQFTIHPMPSGTFTVVELRYKNGIAIDSGNNYWVAFDRVGLGKYDGSSWTMYDTINGLLPSQKVTDVIIDNQNRILASTGKGLSIYDGTTWQHFNNSNSPLPIGGATTVTSSGNIIWVGTNSGIYNYDGTNWTSYTVSTSGLVSDSITGIAVGNNGSVWIGTKHGISKFFNTSWNNYSSSNTSLSNDNIKSIKADSANVAWIINATSNCYTLNNTATDFIALSEILPAPLNGCSTWNSLVFSELAENNGSIYVIKDNPNPVPSTAESNSILLQITADHKFKYTGAEHGLTSATTLLQIDYRNGKFADIGFYIQSTQPSFYIAS
ncbi:MAG: two-component regulator propeller domain-containing protein, partial [Bacteroidota bacterium]